MTTRRALALSFLDRYAALIIATIASLVIARVLTPSEIGVYSVVMVLLGFAATFRDLGASPYLISRRQLTDRDLRLAFTVQLLLGGTLAIAILFAAGPIAGFYNDPRMREICYVLSVNFLVTPWLAYPHSVLAREMRFGSIAIVRFVGAVSYAAVAIATALAGSGPISLALANLATTVASIITIQWVKRVRLPRLPMVRGIGEVLSFGGQFTAMSLFDTARTGSAELSLGRLQGMEAAGYFGRGQGVVNLFEQLVLNAVHQVALPFFSKEVREKRELREPFLVAVSLLTGLGWPFFAAIALLAYPVVRLLYGPQWDDAVDPVRWLCLSAAIGLPGVMCGAPLVALGAMREVLRTAALSALVTVTLAIVGATQGVVATTQLLCASSLVTALLFLRLAKRHMEYDASALARALVRSAGIAVSGAAIPAIIVATMGWRPDQFVVATLTGALGAALGVVASARLLKHPLWGEIERVLAKIATVAKYSRT